IEWLYTPSDKLQDYLEGLKAAEIAKIPEERLAEMEEPPKVHIHFSGVVVTSDIAEEVLEQLTSNVDAYSLFKDKGVTIFDQRVDGMCRRAVMRELPIEESHYDTILYLYRNLFGG
ncbi:hypothetical protein, partial [Streptococcus suis]